MADHDATSEPPPNDDPERARPLPPDTGGEIDEEALAEKTPDSLTAPEMVTALKQQATSARDDGVLQEWLEDQALRALPLEKFVTPEQEDALVELVADGLAAKAPDLIDFLRSRL